MQRSPAPRTPSADNASNRLRTYSEMTTSNGDLNWIANYIWGIADDVLRDLYVRGKYRDVILPMTVLRRLDAVLEGSKQAVLDMKASLDDAGVVEQDPALRQAAGQAFYNTSPFTLRDPRARANRQQLTADFTAYLDGFFAQRAGHSRQLRVPQPDPTAVPRGCPGHADREAHLAGHQPEPRPGAQHRRLGQASRARQPRHGHDLRGAGAPASTRRTTRRRVSTGPRATRSG